MDVLFPESRLDAAIVLDLATGEKGVDLASFASDARTALARHLAFRDADRRGAAGLPAMSDVTAFYNAYYWFLVFARLHQASSGPDAGLEQQALQLLEAAPDDIDWLIVEQIDAAAKR